MKENARTQAEVIEPEILDENGQPIAATKPSAHGDVYGRVGFLTGFFALAFSVVVMILGALITIFIITPLLLIGRLFGLQIKTLRR
ncbi:MAG: hypothetical protein J6U96_01100 [Elusimicrobiaceae bacterium]|nr:hypothetical protein [Elusimicrobiaceae bacterium]